jgi:hypothetical protein
VQHSALLIKMFRPKMSRPDGLSAAPLHGQWPEGHASIPLALWPATSASKPLVVGLMADHAADRRTTQGAQGASTSQDGASDSPNACANRGITALLRHPAARTQTEQGDSDHRPTCYSLSHFHGDLPR